MPTFELHGRTLSRAGPFPLLVARHSFATTARYAAVRSLVVRSGAGDVSVRAAPPGSALVVTAQRSESLFKPTLGARMAGDGTLTLSASCPADGRLWCGVHYELSVPPDVAVSVSTGFSDIDAAGLRSTSSIRLDTTAGDITATVHVDPAAPRAIDAHSSLGDITITTS